MNNLTTNLTNRSCILCDTTYLPKHPRQRFCCNNCSEINKKNWFKEYNIINRGKILEKRKPNDKKYYLKHINKIKISQKNYAKKNCKKISEYQHDNYLDNKENRKKYLKEYREKNKIRIKQYQKEYELNNKFKIKAQRELRLDKKKHPRLYPNECIICGDNENIDYHHPDYNFPLSVYPMCRSHHLQIHRVGGVEN